MCVHACAGQLVHPCVQKLGDKLGATYFSFFPFFFTPPPPDPRFDFCFVLFSGQVSPACYSANMLGWLVVSPS